MTYLAKIKYNGPSKTEIGGIKYSNGIWVFIYPHTELGVPHDEYIESMKRRAASNPQTWSVSVPEEPKEAEPEKAKAQRPGSLFKNIGSAPRKIIEKVGHRETSEGGV